MSVVLTIFFLRNLGIVSARITQWQDDVISASLDSLICQEKILQAVRVLTAHARHVLLKLGSGFLYSVDEACMKWCM